MIYLYCLFHGLLPVKNERIRLYLLARGQMTLKAEYMIK